jgi:hypothetical protein
MVERIAGDAAARQAPHQDPAGWRVHIGDGVGGIAAVEDPENRGPTGEDQGAARLPHGSYRIAVPGEGGLVPARSADAGGAHHDVGFGFANGVSQAQRVAEVAHNGLDTAHARALADRSDRASPKT